MPIPNCCNRNSTDEDHAPGCPYGRTGATPIEEAATMRLALETIALDSCEMTRDRPGACVTDPGRVYPSNPTVNGTAYEMCPACVAWGALNAPEPLAAARDEARIHRQILWARLAREDMERLLADE